MSRPTSTFLSDAVMDIARGWGEALDDGDGPLDVADGEEDCDGDAEGVADVEAWSRARPSPKLDPAKTTEIDREMRVTMSAMRAGNLVPSTPLG